MKNKILIFPKFELKYIFFLLFFLVSFIKIIIRKLIDDENKGISFRLFYIYIYTISDLFSVIPYLLSIYIPKKKINKINEHNLTKKRTEINSTQKSIEYIYNDEENDYKIRMKKGPFLVAIFDLAAQLCVFIFYLIKGKNKREVEEYQLNILLIFNIFSKYILSFFILKTYFYKHHYFSFCINIICSIILGIKDLLFLLDKRNSSFLNIIIYILVKIFNTIFFSVEDVYGKKVLTNNFLSPYSLLFYKGLYEIIFLFFFSIPFIFIKIEKDNIFNGFKEIFNNINILKEISLMITNFFYNIFIWIIVDKFSPNHLAMANIFESFGYFLAQLIFENDINIWNLIITIIAFIFLFFGAFIHNEFIILNFCGLNEKTKLFLDDKANKDSHQTKRSDSSYTDSEFDENNSILNDNEDTSKLMEMNSNN